MPPPNCSCKVISGRNGFLRDNTSWIIGRIFRDFESWMDDGKANGPIRIHLNQMLDERWKALKEKAAKKEPDSGERVKGPSEPVFAFPFTRRLRLHRVFLAATSYIESDLPPSSSSKESPLFRAAFMVTRAFS